MKNFVFAAAVIVVCSSVAQAADIATRPYPTAPMAPVSSWSGFYAGVNVGYGFNDPTVSYVSGDSNFTASTAPGLGTPIPPASYNVKGVTGGGQLGYNLQFNQNWVFGLEADLNASDVKGSATSTFTLSTFPGYSANANQSVDWFGTVRARFGWLPSNNLLIYGTGGFAYALVKENVALFNPTGAANANQNGAFGYFCAPASNCFAGTSSNISTGYTAGAGLEYAVWKNITFRVEYLYVNLGSQASVHAVTFNSNTAAAPSSVIAKFSSLDFNVVRVGLNYRF